MRSKITRKLFSSNTSTYNFHLKQTQLGINLKLLNNNESFTLKNLKDEILKHKKFENLEFYSWDNSRLSIENRLVDVLKEEELNPTYIKIDRLEFFELKNNEEKTVNLSMLENNTININNNINFIKLQTYYNNLLEEKLILNTEEQKNFEENINTTTTNTTFTPTHTTTTTNISTLYEKLHLLKKEYSTLLKNEEILSKSADKKTLFLILLAGSLFIIELILLYYGTFIVFSWDLTEPMIYLVTCANLVLVLLIKTKFRNVPAHKYLRGYFMRKKTQNSRINSIRSNISSMERMINVNI